MQAIEQFVYVDYLTGLLFSSQLISLDMGALIAGAKYRGEFEDRLKAVFKEVTKSDGQIIFSLMKSILSLELGLPMVQWMLAIC
uniref:Putative P-loop containing nucleoside triphosphate hydrolase n=1 Tax=Helianthus annuus TaxID=4232 RepID=A0A251SGF0_HELAN